MVGASDILRAKVLLVDDNEENLHILEELLRAAGYTAVTATTDSRAVRDMHEREHFDLIVLDVQMPGMDGFEVMQALKDVEKDYLPVLAVTGDPSHKLRTLQAGAKDFVSKPFDWDEVLMRVHNMLEVRLLHNEARQHAMMLESLALHDALTGLANRRLLPEKMGTAMAHARRNGASMAVLCVDLDGFKAVNDTLGHGAGDRLLKSVATRLVGAVRAEDTVARIGGDEFVISLWQVQGAPDTALVAQKVIDAVSRPYEIEGRTVTVTASIGASLFPAHGVDVDELIAAADAALYEAKRAGKNTCRIAQK